MKIRLSNALQANVLIVCLCTTAAIGVILVAYLQLGASSENLTVRSQTWNLALPVAEAGLEEALTHLNYTKGVDLDSNGWSKKGTVYSRTRTLSPESFYQVGIEQKGGKNEQATITATGYVLVPPSTNYISRTVTSEAVRTNYVFPRAIVARNHIRLGKGSLIDSFDSTDINYSTGGQYDPTRRKDGGKIATTSTKKNGIKIEDTKVYGDAATAEKGGVEFKGKGSLGDSAWIGSGKTGAQDGKIENTYQYDFAPVQAPWTGGVIAPTGGKIDKVEYQYILGSGDWELSGKVDLKKPMLVTGDAVLYVKGDFKAEANIIIENSASLTLYMGGGKFEVKDKNIELNAGNAAQFQYYGLPTNKTFIMKKKDADFTGVIYAPSARIMIEGNNNVIGSIVGKCVHLKHNGQMHYDEGLHKISTEADLYRVVSWTE